MRIALLGATGATGTEVARQALAGGHRVTALVRDPARLAVPAAPGLVVVRGGWDDPAVLDALLDGADVVVSALGPARTGSATVCADAVRAVLPAMARHGVRRLVAVSAHGAAESRDRSLYARLVWALQGRKMRDKEAMEALVRASDVEWTLVRPPALTSGPRTGAYRVTTTGGVAVTARISRADLADFVLREAADGSYRGRTPVLAS